MSKTPNTDTVDDAAVVPSIRDTLRSIEADLADPDRPPVFITHRQRLVQVLSGLGLSLHDISVALNIPPKQVVDEFDADIEKGSTLANLSVAHVAYRMALEGNEAMVKFWLQCRAGWTPKQVVEHTGKDGNPIEIEISAKQKLMQLINPDQ